MRNWMRRRMDAPPASPGAGPAVCGATEAPLDHREAEDGAAGDEVLLPFALLTDRAAHLTPPDLLEHAAIARTLAASIRGTPKEDPLGIALYGAWGQGKSTIKRLLKNELTPEIERGSHVFVNIDAWKYAHEGTRLPLRRHFLLEAFRAAKRDDEADELQRHFSLARTSQELRWDVLRAGKALVGGIARRARWTLLRAGLFAFFLVVVAILVPVRALGDPLQWLLSALLVAAAFLVTAILPYLREGLYVTTRSDPSWSIEEFDRHLSHLLKTTQQHVDRFIFFIDDLDRCTDEIVVEAVETLQAFFGRSRCAYVVAADRGQLKRAVRHRSSGPVRHGIDAGPIPPDETFLEKIFQVTVEVPRLSLAAVQRYATDIAGGTRLKDLPDEQRRALLSYLVHPRVGSPRQVRVIINDFLVAWRAAEEREGSEGAYLRSGELTGDLLLLAKLVVLRSHFPWFLALLYEDPDLLRVWQENQLRGVATDPDRIASVRATVEAAASSAISEASEFIDARHDGDDESREPAALPTESLLTALRAYLSLTHRSLPRDPAHLQEYLHLRSREEFAGLVGGVGDEYRLAIASGDESELRRLADADPDQLSQAFKVALALSQEPNPVQRDAGRRSMIAMLSRLSDEALEALGSASAEILYAEDAGTLAMIENEDVRAHSRLVLWMPLAVLRSHARRAPLDDPRALDLLARALVAAEIPDVWEQVIARIESPTDCDALNDATKRLPPTIVEALVGPAISAMRRVFEAPLERVDDEALVLRDVSGSWVTFTRPDGDEWRMWRSNTTELETEVAVGTEVVVSAHVDIDEDWVIEKLDFGGSAPIVWEERKETFSREARDARWALLHGMAVRASYPLEPLTRLMRYEYVSEDDAIRVPRLVLESLRRSASGPSSDFVQVLAEKRFPLALGRAELEALEALVSVPASLRAEQMRQLALRAANIAEARTNRALLQDLRRILERARGTRRAGDWRTAAGAVGIPKDFETGNRVIYNVLAPLAAQVAGERLAARISERLRVLEGRDATDDEKSAALHEVRILFDMFEEIGAAAPRDVRAPVRRLPLRASVDEYAARVVLLRARIRALDLVLPTRVLAVASKFSRTAAAAVQEHALKRAPLRRDQLEAVLAGIATFPPRSPDARAVTGQVMRRHERVVSRPMQLATIAREGGWRTVEAVDERALITILGEIASRLPTQLAEAEKLLSAVPAWQSAPKRVRKEAAERLADLAGKASNADELRAVLRAALELFPDRRRVEGVQALRRGISRAVGRVEMRGNLELRDMLLASATDLRLQPAGQHWFTRLVERAVRE